MYERWGQPNKKKIKIPAQNKFSFTKRNIRALLVSLHGSKRPVFFCPPSSKSANVAIGHEWAKKKRVSVKCVT